MDRHLYLLIFANPPFFFSILKDSCFLRVWSFRPTGVNPRVPLVLPPRVLPAVNQGSTLAGSFIDGAIVRNEKTTSWSNLGITPGRTWGKGDEKRPPTLNRQSR